MEKIDLPVKNKEEAYENIIEMSQNNVYTTGNLLNFSSFKNNHRLIAINLNEEINLKDPQQISFIGKVGEGRATLFSIIEK